MTIIIQVVISMKDLESKIIKKSSNSLVYVMYLGLSNLVSINPDDLYMGIFRKQEAYSSLLLNKYDMFKYLEQMYIETNGQIEYKCRGFKDTIELINIIRNEGKTNYIILPALKGAFVKFRNLKSGKGSLNSDILWLLLYSDDKGRIKGISQSYFIHKGHYTESDIEKICISNHSLSKTGLKDVSNICYLLKRVN